MRLLAWTMLSIAAISGTPAQEQTYGSAFPVCIQTYGITGNAIDGSYASMDACRASASGRAAQCIANPYYAATSVRRKLRRY
jgi:predicted secreted Zn-dependent protease